MIRKPFLLIVNHIWVLWLTIEEIIIRLSLEVAVKRVFGVTTVLKRAPKNATNLTI